MDTETSTLAFRTTINEIKNTCPGISNIFILDENRQVITQDENTAKELIDCASESLVLLMKTAQMTGGIDAFTCTGSSQKINFTRYESNYFVTVASSETDERTLTTLARVMVPSMLKLAQEVITSQKETVADAPKLNKTPPKSPPASAPAMDAAPTVARVPSPSPVPAPSRSKPSILDLPASEFAVENLSGINIISSDPETIYVDRVLLGEWKELYGNENIEWASVESVDTNKRFKCRFQPIKSQKFEGQNIVQIPNRIQNKLEIKKGAAVRIRPIIDEGEK
jgi:hypothetical protein